MANFGNEVFVLKFYPQRQGFGSKCRSFQERVLRDRYDPLGMEWPLILLMVGIVLASVLLGVATTLATLEYNRFHTLKEWRSSHVTSVFPSIPSPLPPPLPEAEIVPPGTINGKCEETQQVRHAESPESPKSPTAEAEELVEITPAQIVPKSSRHPEQRQALPLFTPRTRCNTTDMVEVRNPVEVAVVIPRRQVWPKCQHMCQPYTPLSLAPVVTKPEKPAVAMAVPIFQGKVQFEHIDVLQRQLPRQPAQTQKAPLICTPCTPKLPNITGATEPKLLEHLTQQRIIRRSNLQPSLSFVVPDLVPALEFSVQKPFVPLPSFNPHALRVGRFEVEPTKKPELLQVVSRSLTLPATMVPSSWPARGEAQAQRFRLPEVRAIPEIFGGQCPINHSGSQLHEISHLPSMHQKTPQLAYRQTPVVLGTAAPFNPDAKIVWRINISPQAQNDWPKPLMPVHPLPTSRAPALKRRHTRQALRKPMAKVMRPRVPKVLRPQKELFLPIESPQSSRSSPVSSPSGYLTSTLGGPFWRNDKQRTPRNRSREPEETPGPGDYSPEHPGIRGRIPGRVPGFPEKANAARCKQPGLGVLLPLDATQPDAPRSPGVSKSKAKCAAHRVRGLRLCDKPKVITYQWSPGQRKFWVLSLSRPISWTLSDFVACLMV